MADKFPVRVAFSYNGTEVTRDETNKVNLTAMWVASGSPKNQDPRQWQRKEGAGFIASLARSLDVPTGHIARSDKGGKGGGGTTWAHWQAALAYAKYLSHDFHRFVNEAFREWAEEKANPDLKATRAVDGYRARGWDDKHILSRLEGIVQRRGFTDTLKDHDVKGVGYAHCTDTINIQVLGATAREVKIARGLSVSAKTRDHLESHELAALRFAEALAERSIKNECAHGNGQCCDVCRRSGEAVKTAMRMMGA